MKYPLAFLIAWTMLAAPVLAQPERAVTTRILVAYYSETGNTEALGKALVEGTKMVPDVETTLRKVAEVTDEEIESADGILVGTPVYWASLHARVKDFLDRVGRVLDPETLGEGRTAGAFCTGGAPSSGNELARIAILSAFLNMRFVVVGGIELDGFGTLGAAATTGPSDPGLSKGELEAARRTGARFARITTDLDRPRAPAEP